MLALSFGDPAKHVAAARAAGIRVVSQVQDRASALEAERAGVDAVVAQGTEAGGHTGSVGTLTLLQIVLDTVGMLDRIEPAASIALRIARDAETHLRAAQSLVR